MVNTFLSGSVQNVGSGSFGTVSATMLTANQNRISAIFVNDGPSVAYLSLSSTATANTGVRLSATGGSYEITPDKLYTGAVSAITASGTTAMTVMQLLSQ